MAINDTFPGIIMSATKMTFHVRAKRNDSESSNAYCKEASLLIDTNLAGRIDAFNPAELLLAALSACMIKSIERVTPILKFQLRGVEVELNGVRQDSPPKMETIHYIIRVDTDESDHRLALLHDNVKKFGTVFNTVSPGTELHGELIRK
jgi:uncharacterized OsmC-like protein